MADDFRYHIDHHVGLVPPADLLQARADHDRGALDDAGLRAAEDSAIRDALRLQRRLGLIAMGDGQYRRRSPLSVFYDHVDGFAAALEGGPIAELLGERLTPVRRALGGSPVPRERLAQREAEFLVAHCKQRNRVVALPSPGYVAALCATGDEGSGQELAAIVRDEVAALAAQGIEYVQLHNPVIAFLLTVAGRERARGLGIDPDATLDLILSTDGAVLSDLDAPADFRVALDITTCGELDTGQGYDTRTLAGFLDRQPFERLCVEYLAADAGRFPIEELRPDCVVALGIVDVGTPEMESADELVDLVDKAATVMDIDSIALSTNGPFHAGTRFNADRQRDKLQIVETVARYYWGNEL
ncbi:hypothetical protein [Actinoplanes subtropicus]|uniref:hypothetical protein n=1 Tax=Actinoplanes subtropicus TaxID=543632 RepID=UPI0004C3CBCB|nr:hypothetical protein [Actinoplanes subtropicus]